MFASLAQFAFAMPSKKEIARVQPTVLELMSEHVKDHKAKKKSAKEVGDAAVELAKDAVGEAAKYILLKGAIDYYALAREYDLAADALEALRESVEDIPADDVAAIASRALSRARKGEAERLRTIGRIASMQARAEADIKSFRSAKPYDRDAMGRLADAYVRHGDWPEALEVFSKLGNKAAAFELNPAKVKDFDSLKAADFWWNFRAKDVDPYRVHAAVLYKAALDAGLAKGLQKNLAEKRIEEVKSVKVPIAADSGGAMLIANVASVETAGLCGIQLWENGPYWAECNVGATKPEEYGYYFWWGDTVGYTNAGSGWISVKDGTGISFSKSGTAASTFGKGNSALQSAGYIDSAGNLVASHDAATAYLGSPWRMPTDAELSALVSNCTTTWTTTNGVSGRLVTGKGEYVNRSIFLPAAGGGGGSDLYYPGSIGYYWSSTPNSDDSDGAWDLDFNSSYFYRDDDGGRYCGQSVRPVRGFAK